jgi:hypothetical protein
MSDTPDSSPDPMPMGNILDILQLSLTRHLSNRNHHLHLPVNG